MARLGHDLLRVVPCLFYAAVYALILSLVRLSGFSPVLGDFSMAAGLNVGFVLIYGLWYSPVIVIATALEGMWYHPLPYSTHVSLLYCIGTAAVQIGMASGLRRLAGESGTTLKKKWGMAGFIALSISASAILGFAASVKYLLEGNADLFFLELWPRWSGFCTGIICIAPAMVIYAGPWVQDLLFGRKPDVMLTQQLHSTGANKRRAIVALVFAALSSAVLFISLQVGMSDRIYLFLLLSVPLIWISVWRGQEGLSIAVPSMFIITAGFLRLANAADLMKALLPVLLIAAINSYMIAAGVSHSRETDRQMERRDAILDAVSYAAQRFLGGVGWEPGVQELIRRMGEASSVSRVFLIDNRRPNLGGQVGDTHLYEWSSPSVPAGDSDKQVLNLIRGQMIEELSGKLSMGQPHVYLTRDLDRKRQDILEAMNVRSGVIIPMFVDRQWWGCLGLEHCVVDRDWMDSEIDSLNMAGRILGTLIASVRVEQQFRQLTGNINAVFWISGPDGRVKQYVSPGYEEVWGRSCTSLQKDPGSWLEAIRVEDQSRVSEALSKQVWGEYDEEFRVERPDGSLRWIHDRAFPVRDQAGKVHRIVGIAEDITRRKEAEEQLRAVTVMLSSLINHLHSGIMVEDEARRITHVNEAFINTFNVPISSLSGVDSRLLFAQTAAFAERIEDVIKAGLPVLGEELEWQDRIFLRNYVPLSTNGSGRYHLWQYEDITESRHAEEQIKASLKEKEVLLKEIHHRVKNNLQIISSLLNLQSAEIEDPKATQKFAESQDRVKAMALIHERLYQSGDLAKIDFAGYVRSLTGHLAKSYRVNAAVIRLSLEVESVPMNLDVAIPCGLIINELVSNAFKYAFKEGKGGDIKVRFSQEADGGMKLVVSDNGVGIPANVNPEESDSLGLKLVRTLSEQIGGSARYQSLNGFLCEISIPQMKG